MSITATTPEQPRKPPQHRISGKVARAIEAMVWEGLPRKQAAERADISEHGLYKALRSPPVKAAYLRELEVLRDSERARNFHTLCEVRDQTSNQMARVNAVQAMKEQTEQGLGSLAQRQSPGVTIIIEAPREGRSLTVDANDGEHHQRLTVD